MSRFTALIGALLISLIACSAGAHDSRQLSTTAFAHVADRAVVDNHGLITLDLQDAPLAATLQTIAAFSGRNVVVSDRVNGTTTLRLEQVPWEQALNTLMNLHALGTRRSGTVMLIAPLEDLLTRDAIERQLAEADAAQQPIQTRLHAVRYGNAADLAALLGSDGGELLSERGQISADARTNTLILRDNVTQLDILSAIISALDAPLRQVLIETRIVIARSDFSRELGIRLGASALAESGGGLRIGGTLGGGLSDTAVGFQIDGREGLLIDLPALAPSAALGLTLGHLTNRILQLELSAMELEGRGQIISSPRVITIDQQTARISQGVDIPYQQSAGEGNTSIAFQEALLSLEVTPQVTPDGSILMQLGVTKDSVGQVFDGIPSIDTQSLSTQVLVQDGATLILGGILEQESRQTDSRVPGLSSLPGIGRLFRHQRNSRREAELLIFVTPHIIEKR